MPPISKLLVANRGEIACRIFRTCKEMGIASVAVCSEADSAALHVALADSAEEIGLSPAPKSYLNMDAILAAAARSGADAVHPGYGFLAENGGFARAVQRAGLTWIGPSPEMIEAMGDKERARGIAVDCGVPVLPGSKRFAAFDADALHAAGEQVEYPMLVKAAAGGGGIGMRVVDSPDTLLSQVETTQKLADRMFGDASVYLERYVANARHIEVQVFGFGDGGGVHIFDRDCSVQRRFQKVIEEAPAPALPKALRQRLLDAALVLVAKQNYLGAGTVEFIYDYDRQEFYFLEMNTRIQVEHTVTEMITGIDLIRWQIEAAAEGFDAPQQSDIECSGHALEGRIYAERPEKNFLPSPGELSRLNFPAEGSDLRIDCGVREGDQITPFYDPMIAKIIVRGSSREAAIKRMSKALAQIEIWGVDTNLKFLQEVLIDPHFVQAKMTTRYVETRRELVKKSS
jgi:3-methylcrotonyl-CoA carboxylase alpha subunit